MRVAKEHIYEVIDAETGLSRLAVPAGSAVTAEEMKRLGIRRHQLEDVDEPEEPGEAA